MQLRNLGRSGLKVSLIGLGCSSMGGRLDFNASQALIDAALDLGVTLLDTADTYVGDGGAEEMLGRCMGSRRSAFVIATKFGQKTGCSRREIVASVEGSLRRLRTDRIDLYQIHWPDTETAIEETLRALDDLTHAGKVLYAGCSNFDAWRLADAAWTARHYGLNPLVSCQNPYSLLERDIEAELLPAMLTYGVGLIPYFPLARGLLTGRYNTSRPPSDGSSMMEYEQFARRFLTERNFAVASRLQAFCAARQRSMIELAFSWLASRPAVAGIIAGASTRSQLAQNVQSVSWRLSADELAEIDQLTSPVTAA